MGPSPKRTAGWAGSFALHGGSSRTPARPCAVLRREGCSGMTRTPAAPLEGGPPSLVPVTSPLAIHALPEATPSGEGSPQQGSPPAEHSARTHRRAVPGSERGLGRAESARRGCQGPWVSSGPKCRAGRSWTVWGDVVTMPEPRRCSPAARQAARRRWTPRARGTRTRTRSTGLRPRAREGTPDTGTEPWAQGKRPRTRGRRPGRGDGTPSTGEGTPSTGKAPHGNRAGPSLWWW